MSCAILSLTPGMPFNSSAVAVLAFNILSDMQLDNECKLYIFVYFFNANLEDSARTNLQICLVARLIRLLLIFSISLCAVVKITYAST